MQAEQTKSLAVRLPFLALGCLLVGLGYIGAAVPGMPSTVFLLGAVWAFKKSSPKFESWLLYHPLFGATLRQWEESRSISPRVKVIAISTMAVCVSISVLVIHSLTLKWLVLGLAVVGAAVIATRKSA